MFAEDLGWCLRDGQEADRNILGRMPVVGCRTLAKVDVILKDGFWTRAPKVANSVEGRLWRYKERNAVLLFPFNR